MLNVLDILNSYSGSFITIIIVSVLFCIAYFIVDYIFNRYPLYKIAKSINFENAWIVWIPLFFDYFIVKISEYDGSGTLIIKGKSFDRNLLAWFTILGRALSIVPLVGTISFYLIKWAIVGAACRDFYARAENKQLYETSVIGYFSGLFRIVLSAKLYQYLYIMDRNKRISLSKEY